MSSWARAGEDFGSREPRRLGWVIPVAVITMALVLGLFLGRATSPAQTVQVRTVPLAPGSTRVESGVPVGYGHSQAGAVDAATAYAVALNGPMLLDLDGLRAAAGAIAVPEYRDQLVSQGDFARPTPLLLSLPRRA